MFQVRAVPTRARCTLRVRRGVTAVPSSAPAWTPARVATTAKTRKSVCFVMRAVRRVFNDVHLTTVKSHRPLYVV